MVPLCSEAAGHKMIVVSKDGLLWCKGQSKIKIYKDQVTPLYLHEHKFNMIRVFLGFDVGIWVNLEHGLL